MEDFAEVRFAAATTTAALARLPAGKPGLDAVAIGLTGQRETRHCGKAEAESFESLPSGYRARYAFRQMIKFVIHRFCFFRP